MTFPLPRPAAMEARSVDAVPRGSPWQYEPKWDGFRCLLSRNHAKVSLRSKSGEDLGRYFPELIDAARRLKAKTFLLDGEIVVPHGKAFSFDELLQRIHPAASRISAALLRWRPDKAPRQCRLDQLKQKSARPMKLLT